MTRTRTILASLLVSSALVPACASMDSSDPDPRDDAANGVAADSAAIGWRASSIAALDGTTGPGAALTVATPAGTVAGDVEIAAVATYASTTVTAPSGWTLVKSQSDAATTIGKKGVATSVFSHVAGAHEPASVSFALSASSRGVGTIQSYVNVDPTSPIDGVSSAAESTSRTAHTTPGITTTAVGDVLVGVFASVSPVEPATTTSSMAHERADRSCGDAGSWGIELALYDSAPRTAAGNEAGRAATTTGATDGAAMTLLALRPKKTSAPTLFGAAFRPRDDANFATLSSAWGGFQIDRSYDDNAGIQPFLDTHQPFDLAHGAASHFSFKYQPASVISGSHDAELRRFFQGIEDGHLTYWTYFHEPDDQIYEDHAFSATEYRAAWAHIRTLADGVTATRPNLQIKATLIIMEFSMRHPEDRPLTGPNGMYPGDDVIDVFGVDGYNQGAKNGVITDPADKFGKVIDFAKAHDKPWGIGELGSCPVAGKPAGRAQFMEEALTFFADSGYPPLFVEWFDIDGECDYRIEHEAASSAIWKQAMTEGLGSF